LPLNALIAHSPTIPEVGQGAQSLSDVIRFPVCFASRDSTGTSVTFNVMAKGSQKMNTLPKTNTTPARKPSKKESSLGLPTINFQVLMLCWFFGTARLGMR